MNKAKIRNNPSCQYVEQKPEELSLALFNSKINYSNFIIYNQKSFSFSDISLHANIIGESHIITISRDQDFIFSEILACTDLTKIKRKPLLSIYNPSSNTACYSTKHCEYQVEVTRFDYDGIGHFASGFKKIKGKIASPDNKRNILNHIFPDINSKKFIDVLPETLLSFDFTGLNKNIFSWQTLHAYPSCLSIVITKTGLKFK